MVKDILKAAEDHMQKSVEVLEQDLKTIRTGRASPALVERLPISYYGTPTPLEQLRHDFRAGAADARHSALRSRLPERDRARHSGLRSGPHAEQRWQDHSPAYSAPDRRTTPSPC